MTVAQRSHTELEHCAVTVTRPQVAGAMGALDGVSRAWESSEGETEGEEMMRRGSLPTIPTTRRGSRLQDLLRYNQERKRKRDGKYKKDSQGFVWKRMPAPYDEYQAYGTPANPVVLPTPPSPLITAAISPEQLAAMAAAVAAGSSGARGLPKQYIQPEHLAALAPGDQALTGPNSQVIGVTPSTTTPVIQPVSRKPSQNRKKSSRTSEVGDPPPTYAQMEGNGHQYGGPGIPSSHYGGPGIPSSLPVSGPPTSAAPQHWQHQQPGRSQAKVSRTGGPGRLPGGGGGNGTSRRMPPDVDSISLHSENSFKTCSSEPDLPLVPRAVSDNYKYSGTSSLERSAASLKTLQQQRYSNALDAAVGTSTSTSVSNSTGALAAPSSKASSVGSVPHTPASSSRTKR
jgi:hypothetical protein